MWPLATSPPAERSPTGLRTEPFTWSGLDSPEGGKATWDLLLLSATILGMATEIKLHQTPGDVGASLARRVWAEPRLPGDAPGAVVTTT